MIGSLLTRFGPALVPVLIGAIPAFAAGWFAHGVKFDWVDRPAIIREATATADAACAIRTMDAANRAEQAERARQMAANADARRIYDEALDASQRAALAAQSKFEQETADYAAQLADEGRSNLWTELDLDERDQWLLEHGAASPD